MADTLIEYEDSTQTGKTLYALLRNASAQWWNGSAMEAFNAVHWTSYAVAMSETGSTGYFTVTTPGSLPAGVYAVGVRVQAGGSPAVSDLSLGGFQGYWDGSAWHAGPTYADELPATPPTGYGPGAGQNTTAVTDLAGGSARNPSVMTVLNSGSAPIQGATVTAYSASAYTSNPATAEVLGATTTDANGHWILNLPTGAGAITLVVAYPGDQTAVVSSAFTV